jgi:long-chain acyl-CoA synthetase
MGATGESISYRELEARSNRLAQLFRARGIERGGAIAVFMENNARFLEVAWAAHRAGLYYATVNAHLTAPEASYIVRDSGAQLVVSSAALAPVAGALDIDVEHRLMVDGTIEGWESLERVTANHPDEPIADEGQGDVMLYSSGTTGRPKGIRKPLRFHALDEREPRAMWDLIGLRDGSVYLCPAPLYHGAPLTWSLASIRSGATVVVMERFDPEQFLHLVDAHRVTHSQLVPTMFVRMLKLPHEVRAAYSLSSLEAVVHAAAPCPIEVKREMIEWWGPIIHEYYSASERIGATFITADEWLDHPGSVGRPFYGHPRILDDDGDEVPAGQPGVIWFEGGPRFEYHNDPEKTAEAHLGDLATVGDVGYVDDDGYLYLTDRASFMIISGGVNIYPQEIENVLITHPKVLDVAVIGVPDDDLGEQVKAIVQPLEWDDASASLELELLAWCRERLSAFKCPRSIDFDRRLPRLDTGKLYKRELRDRYWSE